MTRTGADPLAETDLLVIDGSNLLHALRTGPTALPPAALIGRLRGTIPAATAVELVFDGGPEPGMRRVRIASGVTVRYAGSITGDAAILARAGEFDASAADRLLVVTDDRELRRLLERQGARTARTAWLIGRLERATLSSPSTGNPRPPASGPTVGHGNPAAPIGRDEPGDRERRGWAPGRGATAKHGNGRRRPRTGG